MDTADLDRTFPESLTLLHQIPIDYADGDGIDFEPYAEFMSTKETNSWLEAWTGNEAVDASQYRIFGQDGTGGLAGFWVVNDDSELLEQPIVFFGSEGETAVVAENFGDYLWLLANGIGPCEVIEYGSERIRPDKSFANFAKENAPSKEKSPSELIKKAAKAYPTFSQDIENLCR